MQRLIGYEHMGNFYLLVVVILFALAVSDLIVGVSNDAVNFLTSAVGSGAARKWVIYLVAGSGVLIGATFSSGMMEVARKGVFHPGMFAFSEIMVIFLTVMLTDVLLLNTYNTLGLPTSTTVSLVFELLGSAVAVSMMKIKNLGGSLSDLSHYVNSGKALAIITGILVSIIIAFLAGTILQYIVRLIFTFQYRNLFRYVGSLFGGLAISLITYFIFIKGMDGSTFAALAVGKEKIPLSVWVSKNTGLLLLISFAGWTGFIHLLYWFLKVDILKVVILAGTFALAMAFAGNDLVNFIGVPIAGLKSFLAWKAAGSTDPGNFRMEMLNGEVDTPFLLLFLAGIVMILTLIFSKKARSVTETSVNLSRQEEGEERFGSSALARMVVRNSIALNRKFTRLLPEKVHRTIENRFANQAPSSGNPSTPAFDKLRATVNLVVASTLIAFGTSLKLPLSTTYVTFMAAMGTSLADRAWGRESAVYRVSGVFSVIGGWFLTAMVAFTVSSVIAWVISAGGIPVIIGLLVLSVFLFIRTNTIFKNRSEKTVEDEDLINEKDELNRGVEKSNRQVIKTIIMASKIFSLTFDSFLREDRSLMQEATLLNNEINRKTKKQKRKIIQTISGMKRIDVDSSYFYIQIIDYQREIAHSLNFLHIPLKEHLDNQQTPFTNSQIKEIRELVSKTDEFFNLALHIVKEGNGENVEDLVNRKAVILQLLGEIELDQIKRIKNKEVSTRNSLLFFKALTETKNMLLHSVNLIKSHCNFTKVARKQG